MRFLFPGFAEFFLPMLFLRPPSQMTQSRTAPLSFDRLMNATCDVLIPTSENPETGYNTDDYGQSSPFTLDVIATAAACRPSMLKSGSEWESGKKYAANDWMVYLRPIVTDDAGHAFTLSPRHWLRVTCQDGKVILLNLKAVNDPSGIGHHLEARGEEIITTDGVSL